MNFYNKLNFRDPILVKNSLLFNHKVAFMN